MNETIYKLLHRLLYNGRWDEIKYGNDLLIAQTWLEAIGERNGYQDFISVDEKTK